MQASATENWSEKELMSQSVGLLVHGMHLCILLISHQGDDPLALPPARERHGRCHTAPREPGLLG